jgi:hypothetical protein
LGLTYDNFSGLYTINQTSVEANRANIETLTIALGPSDPSTSTGNSIISIKFPYDAFNANASWTWDFPNASQPIFPIRNATSSTAVLGRTFFQEAYVSANYEINTPNGNTFNVSQAAKTSPGSQIISLYNQTIYNELNTQSKLSRGAIAGIAIGAVVLLAIAAFLVFWFVIKPKRDAKKAAEGDNDGQTAESDPNRPSAGVGGGRGRSGTFESMSTAVTELPESDMRPSPNRHISGLSEMSSDSEVPANRRGTLDTLEEHLHEMGDDKTDAAQWADNARHQRSPKPAELEGEHVLTHPER